MGYSVTQVWVGRSKIGIANLETVLTEVSALQLTNPKAIIAGIIQRLRRSNYIPATVEDEYGRAVYAAYRRSLGEDVPEHAWILEIRIYGGD